MNGRNRFNRGGGGVANGGNRGYGGGNSGGYGKGNSGGYGKGNSGGYGSGNSGNSGGGGYGSGVGTGVGNFGNGVGAAFGGYGSGVGAGGGSMGNGPDKVINAFAGGNNMNNNNLMQVMKTLASNFNLNPPPPPPQRMGCGELRPRHDGLLVELSGRLIKKRVARFVELRDRTGGATQLVILEDKYPRVARRFNNMPPDTVLTVVGLCMMRPKNSRNQTMPTGDIEVEVQDILRIEFPPGAKRTAEKRSYSTMAQTKTLGITSTEYKIAKGENILKYFENREQTCNDLRSDDIGRTVSLVGWIPIASNSKFQQIKDGYGQTQVIVEDPTMQETFKSAPDHTIVQVIGKVVARPKNNFNMKYETGEIEVLVEKVKVLNPDEPYDGPIRDKEKVQKMSINDEVEDDGTNGVGENGNISSTIPASAALEKIKVADTCKFADRTHTCGELSTANVGEKVVICGWLEFQRMGRFIVLRDGYGQTQVLLSDKVVGLEDYASGLALESILRVEGTVVPRPTPTINPKMKTGEIEIDAIRVDVLNPAIKNLPIEVRTFNRANEKLRLQYRYLDLRVHDMQRNLRMRSAVTMRMREYLINYLGFVEVETPTLFRSTPGGAQEFIVPTRKAGHVYSLVQSPQQFKQMLMSGAIDRYFQVARCYRDEATRPDRQPEFTQLDIELSFTKPDDIMQLIEETLLFSWPKEYPKIKIPFERITYDDAMEKYGTDKPDNRFDYLLQNVTSIVEKHYEFSEKFDNIGAYAICVNQENAFWNVATRKHFDELSKDFAGTLFARKFANEQEITDRLTDLLSPELAAELIVELKLQAEDILFLGIGDKKETQTVMGRVRNDYHNYLIENKKVNKFIGNSFLWVIDFPMFERNPETNELESVHHPFTAPHPDDMDTFINSKAEDLEKVRSQAYDLVLNGQEIGGGSIRIHNRDMQHFVLEQILKIPHDHLAHLLSALESGCPPHGGIALGLDRLMSIICRTRSIRDVMAFPKSLNGRDPLSNAPVPITEDEKHLYHIVVDEDHDSSGHNEFEAEPEPEENDVEMDNGSTRAPSVNIEHEEKHGIDVPHKEVQEQAKKKPAKVTRGSKK